MTRRATTRSAIAALVTSLLLVGCGSDDDAQATASLKAEILAGNAMTGSSRITDEQASCVARGAVEEVGTDTLQDYGVLDDDLEVAKKLSEVTLETEDAEALAGTYAGCVDAEKLFEEQVLDQLGEAAKPRVVRCVRQQISEDVVTQVLAQSFAKADATAYAELTEQLAACR